MRGLTRLPEPNILNTKKAIWTANFLASGKNRPDSSKYAHSEIKTQLNSMSHTKCFYCETKLKGITKEVDHHIEVSVDKNLSYEWTNLNLSCDSCNNKIPASVIQITDALNPLVNTDSEIEQHLTFDDEFIEPLNNSVLGLQTIIKYRLDSEVLDTRRLKKLKDFHKVILQIRENQVRENRDYMTTIEINAVHKFKQINNSFSLMFKILIDKNNL